MASPSPSTGVLFQEAVAEMKRRNLPQAEMIMAHPDSPQGPKTRDDLWQAVYELTGYRIPRKAVCKGHSAPFDTFADLYYGETIHGELVTDVLWIGNRGGGKTTNSGFLHGAKGRWFPEHESAIAGAVEKQSQRAYAEFKRFIRRCSEEVVDTLIGSTEWVNGSSTEVLAGTIKAVNGPHPHLAQFDEVELTQPNVFEEWKNMSQGDHRYPGQNLLTSTRKRSYGIVQGLVEEVEESKTREEEPAWDIRIFCIFESMQQVPNCGKGCNCEKVVKGKWEDGTPRTFASVCKGRAKRADGFMTLKDVHRRFRSLARGTWEAQQECLRPSTEGLVHDWLADHHMIPAWYPRPEYGPVYRSWDWGGTNPHSVHWAQLLKVPVKFRFKGEQEPRLFPEGSLITFDEIHHPGGGHYDLGTEVFARTQQWHDLDYEFDIEYDFCDPAGGPTPKADVKKAAEEGGYEIPTWRSIPHTVEISVEKHIEWGEDDRLYIVTPMCPELVNEYGKYHWPEQVEGKPPPKKPVLVDDHAVDDQRYMIWNLYNLGRHQAGQEAPAADYGEQSPHRKATKRAERMAKANARETPISSMTPGYLNRQPQRELPTVRRAPSPSKMP